MPRPHFCELNESLLETVRFKYQLVFSVALKLPDLDGMVNEHTRRPTVDDLWLYKTDHLDFTRSRERAAFVSRRYCLYPVHNRLLVQPCLPPCPSDSPLSTLKPLAPARHTYQHSRVGELKRSSVILIRCCHILAAPCT
jgi:hypothetical protein